MGQLEIDEFNRLKIFEKLDYREEPEAYKSNIPWKVQMQIAATNGKQYQDIVGKLTDYPEFNLPFKRGNGLLLDIGCGWGRWLVSASKKGYTPIGIDLRLEFCETSLEVLSDFGLKGYVVVADLENIPFRDNLFDRIWSFSVIQHTHRDRLENCLNHLSRILASNGEVCLEFPNRKGIHNRLKNVKYSDKYKDDYNSWVVRYYSPQEYKEIFDKYFSDFSYKNHSFLGIGVLKEDLKYVSAKNKLFCAISLFGSLMTEVIPPLKNISDSLYIKIKSQNDRIDMDARKEFFRHDTGNFDNLNVLYLCRCPKYGGKLVMSKDRKKAISEEAGIYYPIYNDIPILIKSEAVPI